MQVWFEVGDDAVDAQELDRPLVVDELVLGGEARVRDVVQARPVQSPDSGDYHTRVDLMLPSRRLDGGKDIFALIEPESYHLGDVPTGNNLHIYPPGSTSRRCCVPQGHLRLEPRARLPEAMCRSAK
jgi:hypothetical protein